jgi:hypothetical protein
LSGRNTISSSTRHLHSVHRLVLIGILGSVVLAVGREIVLRGGDSIGWMKRIEEYTYGNVNLDVGASRFSSLEGAQVLEIFIPSKTIDTFDLYFWVVAFSYRHEIKNHERKARYD